MIKIITIITILITLNTAINITVINASVAFYYPDFNNVIFRTKYSRMD